MKPYRFLIFLPVMLLGGFAGVFAQDSQQDTLFQVSTLGALADGVYDGGVTYGDVKAHGDFGLGTFDALNGELVAVDGAFYQVRSDGAAYPVEDGMTTPFAAVTFFEADYTLQINEPMDCAILGETLLKTFPSPNLYYAIKVSGEFTYLKTRSVEAQQPPYVPLADALANQIIFEFNDVEATMAGFWLPAYIGTLNAVGFHYHALTADQSAGGHVLDCMLKNVTIEIDYTDSLQVQLPDVDPFLQADLTD
jgi:acetolactate decarboxylase